MPCAVAAERIGDRFADFLPGDQLAERVFQIVLCCLAVFSLIAQLSSSVLEFPLFVVHLDIVSAQSAVCLGDFLWLILQVHSGEFLFFHAFDHVFKRVIFICLLAVGVDAHKDYTMFLEFVSELSGVLG